METLLTINPVREGSLSGVAVTAVSTTNGDLTQSTSTVRAVALVTPVDVSGTALMQAFALNFGDLTANAPGSTDGNVVGVAAHVDLTHPHAVTIQADPITLAQASSMTHLTGTTLLAPA